MEGWRSGLHLAMLNHKKPDCSHLPSFYTEFLQDLFHCLLVPKTHLKLLLSHSLQDVADSSYACSCQEVPAAAALRFSKDSVDHEQKCEAIFVSFQQQIWSKLSAIYSSFENGFKTSKDSLEKASLAYIAFRFLDDNVNMISEKKVWAFSNDCIARVWGWLFGNYLEAGWAFLGSW